MIAFVQPPEMVGIEESTMECTQYFTSIRCTSAAGKVLKIKVLEFQKKTRTEEAMSEVKQTVMNKLVMFNDILQQFRKISQI